jgi:hypothetical protein
MMYYILGFRAGFEGVVLASLRHPMLTVSRSWLDVSQHWEARRNGSG